MFFKYQPGMPLDGPSLRLVYARVDQAGPVDDVGDTPLLVLLDCIDAEWLDDNADRADHLSDPGFKEADLDTFAHQGGAGNRLVIECLVAFEASSRVC